MYDYYVWMDGCLYAMVGYVAPTKASHASNSGLLPSNNGGAHHAATSAARPNERISLP